VGKTCAVKSAMIPALPGMGYSQLNEKAQPNHPLGLVFLSWEL